MVAGRGGGGRVISTSHTVVLAKPEPIITGVYFDEDWQMQFSATTDAWGNGSWLSPGRQRKSNLHRGLRPIPVAQMPLHQLAGRGTRQLGFEIDRARAFDRRQMLAAEQ